jgi:hypothetical protein
MRMRSRINLTIDPKIAHRAKQYAKREKTSLSAIVEQYLDQTTKRKGLEAGHSGSFSQQWKGSMKLKNDVSDQRLSRLKQKYGS